MHVQFVLWEELREVKVLNYYFCLSVHFRNECSRRFDKAYRKEGKVTSGKSGESEHIQISREMRFNMVCSVNWLIGSMFS